MIGVRKNLLLELGTMLFFAYPVRSQAFGTQVSYAVGKNPYSVAAADFNGDGKLDLVTANYGPNTVSVLLGNGAGSFAASSHFTVGSGPRSVAAADFNGDGKLDLVTANNVANTVSVLLGNGAGGFAEASSFTVGSWPHSVAAADFNGDGKLDLVTANYDDDTVSVLLGNGAGSFAASSHFTVGSGPHSVAAADFNGDGKLDLVTANYGPNTVSVLLGNGAGSFAAASHFTVGTSPYSVAAADFNGDGKLDLVTANYGPNTVSVLIGNGAGRFAAASHFTVGTSPYSVAAADFNGDGKLDLVTANYGPNTVSVLLGNGAGSFAASSNFTVGSWPNSVAAADFNGDGKLDLVTANYNANTVSVLLGVSAPEPEPAPTPSPNTTYVTLANTIGTISISAIVVALYRSCGNRNAQLVTRLSQVQDSLSSLLSANDPAAILQAAKSLEKSIEAELIKTRGIDSIDNLVNGGVPAPVAGVPSSNQAHAVGVNNAIALPHNVGGLTNNAVTPSSNFGGQFSSAGAQASDDGKQATNLAGPAENAAQVNDGGPVVQDNSNIWPAHNAGGQSNVGAQVNDGGEALASNGDRDKNSVEILIGQVAENDNHGWEMLQAITWLDIDFIPLDVLLELSDNYSLRLSEECLSLITFIQKNRNVGVKLSKAAQREITNYAHNNPGKSKDPIQLVTKLLSVLNKLLYAANQNNPDKILETTTLYKESIIAVLSNVKERNINLANIPEVASLSSIYEEVGRECSISAAAQPDKALLLREEALSHFEKACLLKQALYGDDHPEVEGLRGNIDRIRVTLDEMKGQGTLSYASNSYPEYYNGGIDQILRLRIDTLGFGSDSGVKSLKSRLFPKELSSAISQTVNDVSVAFASDNAKVILAPFSLYNEHWLGLSFRKLGTLVEVTYMDSEQGALLPKIKDGLKAGLSVKGYGSKFSELRLEKQRYNNCGSELIENFIYYLTGNRATQEGALYLHSLMVENNLLDPAEYGLQIQENNKLLGFLSNAAPLAIRSIAAPPNAKTHTASSQRKLTSVRKELHSFDFLANAGIQNEEDSSKRTIAPVDLEHLNKVIDPFGEFIVLDPRIREEDAGVEPPRLTRVMRIESCFPDTNERKLGSLIALPTVVGAPRNDEFALNLLPAINQFNKLWTKWLQDKLYEANAIVYKTNLGFKGLDLAIHSARLIHQPNLDNAKKVALDSSYLYGMVAGVNGYSLAISGAEAAYQTSLGEYQQAVNILGTTVGSMALPYILVRIGNPYLSFAYGALMAMHTIGNAISNAYDFAKELMSKDATLKSAVAYNDLFEWCSASKAYAFSLMNDVVKGLLTQEEAEASNSKPTTITYGTQHYDNCTEVKEVALTGVDGIELLMGEILV